LDPAELLQLSAGFERHFERGQPYAVLNVSHAQAPSVDAHARRQVVAWAGQPRVELASKKLCVGTATVVARPWERHALTAIHWFWTPSTPHEAVSTVSEGIAYCVSRLVERGVPLPGSPAAFSAAASRVVSSLPVAGLTRQSSPPPRRPMSLSGIRQKFDPSLKTLSDKKGSVVIGWVAQSVLWVRCSGHLSRSLGAAFAEELELRLTQGALIRCFLDASSLDSYDLLARTAAVRVLLSNASRLSSLLVLEWNGHASAVGQAVMGAVGTLMQTTTSGAEFEARLLDEAPLARQRIAAAAESSLAQRPPS
jgi:hypothetical protein